MSDVPSHFLWFQDRFPDAAAGYEALGTSVHGSGPLDDKTRALLKVCISGAARLEGGLHAHVRKALRAGVTEDEIYHALLLLVPTVGFPGAMAALAWARDVIEAD
ncbi:MAG: carboxymuconolactone decarboxylase [Planctomycetes bacterium]|nr:carboxymuconolactone decarboxylase [Planctomycetota bacterium]